MSKLLFRSLTLLLASWFLVTPASAEDPVFNLDDYKGKIVYVDFWASWCIPCRASFPFMQTLANEHGDELVIAAISVDAEKLDADTFVAPYDLSFPVFYDLKGELAEQYKVKTMPTSFLYDRNGSMIGVHEGFKQKDIDALRNWVADAINKQ